jgi:hypothetical protein
MDDATGRCAELLQPRQGDIKRSRARVDRDDVKNVKAQHAHAAHAIAGNMECRPRALHTARMKGRTDLDDEIDQPDKQGAGNDCDAGQR